MKKYQGNQYKKSILALAVLAAFNATAQENIKEDSVNKDPLLLEEVHVFGKFQQSMIDRIPVLPKELPFTLNTIDRGFIDDRNFTRPIDVLTTLPNIMRSDDRQGTGTSGFIARGFEAPILVDNRIQTDFRGAGARDDSFVQSYEVLKGPASITNGPVGAGAVINTVQKTPEADGFTSIKLRTDQFGTAVGEFDTNIGEINGSDVALFRVSGALRDQKYDADRTKDESVAIRPVVTLNLGDKVSWRTSYAYTERKLNPNSGFPLLSNGKVPDEIDTDTFTGYANGKGKIKDTLLETELNLDLLDNLKLTVRGSQQDTDFDYKNTASLYNYYAYDGGPGIGLEDPNVYSYPNAAEAEYGSTFYDAQLAYTHTVGGLDQNFVIGMASDKRTYKRLFNEYTYSYYDPSAGPFLLSQLDEPRYGSGGVGDVSIDNSGSFDSDSTLSSFYAEGAVRPHERITILAGLRYDDLEEDEYDDSEVTGRLGITGFITEESTLYASFAQGFVPQFGLRRTNESIEAETSEGFEVGSKGELFNGMMSYEAGLFITDRENVAVSDPLNAPGESFVVSAGKVRAEGAEFTSILNPTEALEISVNLGYTKLDVKDGNDEISEPFFPKFNASVFANYEFDSGLSTGLGVRYMDERKTDTVMASGDKLVFADYYVLDLNVGYQITDDLDVQFDVLNVTNEKYLESTTGFAANMNSGNTLGAPLTASVTLNWTIGH